MKQSAYLRVYGKMKEEILAGLYEYGQKLPSKRTLAERMGVSVITIEHAYVLLCEEGYVESRERSGYYVIYRKSDFLIADETVSEQVYGTAEHTAGGEFPFAVLAKTIRKVLQDYGERLLVKSPNRGCAELRYAISGYLARSIGIVVPPEQVIIGSGAEYFYSILVQLLGSDRIFALENPSYEKIRQVYTANGVTCDLLKLGRDGILTEELERTEASVLHVTPFNSYPSGVSADASKRREYMRWAEKHGYIIEDNYDSELTVSRKFDDTLFSWQGQDCVIYLNTFSNTIAPSLRMGYMLLPEGLTETFEKKLGFYSCTVPVLEQYVLAELLQSGDFERHINRVRRRKRKKEPQ